MEKNMKFPSKWKYKNRFLDYAPLEKYGFVYKIIFPNGDFYIGSKAFFSIQNPKISKKRSNELYSGKGRKPTREKKIKESNWREYNSSSKIVQSRIENGELPSYTIIDIYPVKSEMLFWEAYLIMQEFANKTENNLNDWVSIKYRKP